MELERDSTIERIYRLQELIADTGGNPIAAECADAILGGEVLVPSSVVLEAQHAFDTYCARSDLQEYVTNADAVDGYSELLPKLRAFDGTHVWVGLLIAPKCSYLTFTSKEVDEWIGVLRLKQDALAQKKRKAVAGAGWLLFDQGEFVSLWPDQEHQPVTNDKGPVTNT